MAEFRHQDLTYSLNGWIYQVRRDLKTGWSEKEYHQALLLYLQRLDVPVQSHVRKTILHRGIPIHTFECDLLVWDLIILELKVLLSSEFASAHFAQLIGYLKCWQKGLGILVNFGPTRAVTKRVIWNEPQLEPYENYHSISRRMDEPDREVLQKVRQCLLNVGNQYGLGYPETLYRKIVAIELTHFEIDYQADAEVPAIWQGQLISTHVSNFILIENKFLLSVRALIENPTKRDYAQMKTYMNALGLQYGLIVNFGKQFLQIHAVNNL